MAIDKAGIIDRVIGAFCEGNTLTDDDCFDQTDIRQTLLVEFLGDSRLSDMLDMDWLEFEKIVRDNIENRVKDIWVQDRGEV